MAVCERSNQPEETFYGPVRWACAVMDLGRTDPGGREFLELVGSGGTPGLRAALLNQLGGISIFG